MNCKTASVTVLFNFLKGGEALQFMKEGGLLTKIFLVAYGTFVVNCNALYFCFKKAPKK